MDVNLTQVRAFLTIARFRSFTRAAELLHISQPALTVQIRHLEESLGLRLFDRDTRHVVLTKPGRDLLPKLQRLLSEFEEVASNARDLSTKERGVVRVACVPSVATTCLAQAIERFRERHPLVTFQVQDEMSRQVVSMIQTDIAEFGITNGDPDSNDLDVEDFYRDEIHAVFRKSHPLATLKKLSLSEIAAYPLVLLNVGLPSRTIVDDAFATNHRLIAPVCEVSYTATAISMVRAGLGVALLGSLVIKANNIESFPEVRSRRIEDASMVRCMKLIQKKGRSLSPCAQEFKEVLVKLVKNERWMGGGRRPEVND
jgi:DNA-binding transcriptional LysR family regulator